jgi:hydrogenase maturation protein HypF
MIPATHSHSETKDVRDFRVCDAVAPHLDSLGMMLPYTPLHHLLLNQTDPVLSREPVPPILVMTSGNFSEEPITTDNQEALSRISPLADAFLLHNRDIHIRCDDSVLRVDKGSTSYLRRSRGYAPYPIPLPFDVRSILAVGGELKNTFCLARVMPLWSFHWRCNNELMSSSRASIICRAFPRTPSHCT